MTGFKECINCGWISCTILEVCMTKLQEKQPVFTNLLLDIESNNVATKKRQKEYAIKQANRQERMRHHFFARVPFSGYARRKRKNGQYGHFYNYLHIGRWHAVMRFLKSH